MAKRKGDAEKPPEPAAEVRQLINKNALKRILSASRNASEEVGKINKFVRDKIVAAKKDDLIRSSVAISIVRRLDRLEPEDLALFFDDFDHMCDVGGLRERAESATGELDLGGEAETDGGAEKEVIDGAKDGRQRAKPRLVAPPDGDANANVG